MLARRVAQVRETESNWRPDVLLVIWQDPAWHPTVIHTAQVLSEHGLHVEILSKAVAVQRRFLDGIDFGRNVRVRFVSQAETPRAGRRAYLDFVWRVCRAAQRSKPSCVIGYDVHGFMAAYAATKLVRGSRLIYHNFDLQDPVPSSLMGRLLGAAERVGARRAHLVAVSSGGRAEIFRARARLPCRPLVVGNCQRVKVPRQKTGELRTILGDKGMTFDRLVVRLGALGPGHGIEATVRSVPLWEGNWGLVLAGFVGNYLKELESLVRSVGVEDRVVILPAVTPDLWYDCLYASDLGIALYEPGSINHESMAGAGNKLNLYLKAGLPSVVSDVPDFRALVNQYRFGELADPGSPESISRAVNAILSDSERHAEYARNATSAFLTEFNFEKQFDRMLRRVLAACEATSKKE